MECHAPAHRTNTLASLLHRHRYYVCAAVCIGLAQVFLREFAIPTRERLGSAVARMNGVVAIPANDPRVHQSQLPHHTSDFRPLHPQPRLHHSVRRELVLRASTEPTDVDRNNAVETRTKFQRFRDKLKISRKIKGALIKAGIENRDVVNLISSAGGFVLWGFIVSTLLGTIGVDTKPLIAGCGITGAAIGFAAKDFISNLISGFSLIFAARIRNGANVTVSGYEGIVERIYMTHVVLRSCKGDQILIPSSQVAHGTIIIHPRPSA
mmetsp:Transcript_35624/g.69216  ORF Transcript_35624/g.69216 Transcript_35624/m.69216 type:complete len:266 (-) Transcript_35624:210-1007(-)